MTLYDLAYGFAIVAAAPVWLALPKLRRKVLDALRERNGAIASTDSPDPAVLIHAVSMGEINATTELVRQLQLARPDLRFVITTTSRTGEAQAAKLYAANPKVTRVRFPFDFSRSVGRMLDATRPSVAVLMELEVWPNFTLECRRRNIPVLLVNGRLSAHSLRGYRVLGPLIRPMFSRLSLACVQDEAYAARFAIAGVPADRIRVTGTMKFDTAQIADSIDGAGQAAASLGLQLGVDSIWVCGSTGPGEEALVLDAFAVLRGEFPALRLLIVPRHPERFDEVAGLILSRGLSVTRRSQRMHAAETAPDPASVLLGDTMGELRKFYSIADVVFVGRSLVDLGPKQHGSDMIEPAALGKPVVVGPFTGNFADVMSRFRAADAVREVTDGASLLSAMRSLLQSPEDGKELGRRGRGVVASNQGATARHVEITLRRLPPCPVP